MLGLVLIIFWIVCISVFIYTIKNYSYVRQKIEENKLLQGICLGLVLLIITVIVTFIIIYGINMLDNFEIIDISIFIK